MSEAPDSCLGCGRKLRTGSLFCAACGFRIGEGPDVEPPAQHRLERSRDDIWPVLKGALQLFGALLATSFVAMVAHQLKSSPWVDVIASCVFSIIVVGFALRDRSHVLALLRKGMRTLPMARTVLAVGATALLLSGYFAVLQGMGMPFVNYSDDALAAGWPVWTVYAMTVVQPAIFEEIAFRGVVLDRLQRALGASEALLVQAAMFSVLHLMPLIFPSHFLMGLLFGWLRIRSGSLYPGMLAHAAWNAWVIWNELQAAS